jgi:DNA-binding NarL/FixJ family response regulator
LNGQPKIRILCVDDHVVVRDGIAAILNLQPDMTLVASAATGREALEQYRGARPDVTLMDLRLSDMSGFEAIRAIRAEFPNAKVVVLSSYEGDADIREAMDAGAHGYVAKGMVREELLDVIRSVHAGKRRIPAALAQTLAEHVSDDQLSPRELEVLRYVSTGKRNKEIAPSCQWPKIPSKCTFGIFFRSWARAIAPKPSPSHCAAA